jgi:hypothetical protein
MRKPSKDIYPSFRRRPESSIFNIFWISTFVGMTFLIVSCSCSSCFNREEVPTRVGSESVTLNQATQAQQASLQQAPGPNIRVINIGPSKKEGAGGKSGAASGLPSDTSLDDRLTSRLKEKLAQAYEGRGAKIPEIEIYTSPMSLQSFSKYYEDKGFKIQRTSVPAGQVIAPLLEEKPELAGKIQMSNYTGININQVIVEGANISAADKYIDPESYEVIYKTFVTVTK